MAKKRVYFETAAISYLTADKPILDIVKLARRQLTRQWWEQRNWNQTHLDNPHLRKKANEIIEKCGLTPAAVVTPEVLMEIKND